MRRTAWVVGAAACIVAVGLMSAPLPTAACTNCNANGGSSGGGGYSAAEQGGSGGGGGGSRSFGGGVSNVRCDVFLPTGPRGGEGVLAEEVDTGTLEVGTLVWVACYDATTGDFVYSAELTWPGAAPVYVPPEVLAQRARADLVLPQPQIRTWPAPENQVVNLPTWLHVDNFVSGSRSATAGSVTATVNASPTSVTWVMGDGATVSCTTGGREYAGSVDQTSDCSHTFPRSSAEAPGAVYRGGVTITWHLSWTSNIGVGGDLGDVSTTADVAWAVDQIQSLIGNGR